MDIDSILRLIFAAEDTTFDRLEVSEGDFTLKLERSADGRVTHPAQTHVHQGEVGDSDQPNELSEELADTLEITSPLVGVFHQLPEGRAVKAGDKLRQGEIVCMIEAMKLMNEITMPEDGEIVAVVAENDQMVAYGDLLYRYVKDN